MALPGSLSPQKSKGVLPQTSSLLHMPSTGESKRYRESPNSGIEASTQGYSLEGKL